MVRVDRHPRCGLTVTPTALTFTFVQGGFGPPSQSVSATWTATDAAYFGVALPPGTSSLPSWLLTPSATGGSNSGSVTFNLSTPAGLTPGIKTATLLVGIARADQSVIGSIPVTITLVVKSFGADTSAVASTAVFGSSVAPSSRSVRVGAGAATAWTASSDQAWIRLNGGATASGTTPSTVTIGFEPSFDPTGLATGSHTGTVTFSATGGATDAVAVTLTIDNPTLTVSPATLELAGLGGHDLSPKAIQVALNTGAAAYPWEVSTSSGWMDLAQLATTVAASGSGFTVAPALAAQEWATGTHTGSVTVSATVNGVVFQKTLPVSYQLDDLRLEVSEDAVALTSIDSLSALTRSLSVATNRGTPASWSATSDQAWLDVTAAGTTGVPLVISADPTGLAAETLYKATVTVTSSDPGLSDATETVRVGLWVSALAPDSATTITVATAFDELVADPLRPYVYVHTGGSVLSRYNVYTGAPDGTLPGFGTTLGAMAVSSDGSRLFVVDEATPRMIRVADLDSWTSLPALGTPASTSAPRIAYARTNGFPLLLLSSGTVQLPTTGATLKTFSTPNPGAAIAVSRDGSRLCTLNLGLSPYSVWCQALDVSKTLGVTSPVLIGSTRNSSWGYGGNGQDVALSPDGRRAYVGSGSPYELTVYDPTVLSGEMPVVQAFDIGHRYKAVEVDPSGRIFAAYSAAYLNGAGVRGWDAAGNALGDWPLGEIVRGGLAVSGDGRRVVALTGTTTPTAMKIFTVPAP
jgi:hypothetical protein